MVTVTNETTGGNVEYISGEFKINGEFRVIPSTGKVRTLDVSVYRKDVHAGSINAHAEGESIRFNYNGMSQANSEAVVSAVNDFIAKLETKYVTNVNKEA